MRYFMQKYRKFILKGFAILILIANPYITVIAFLAAREERSYLDGYGGECLVPLILLGLSFWLFRSGKKYGNGENRQGLNQHGGD